jgi:hypothetical protein
MSENLTIQTIAAFQRIQESLLGKTEDNFDELIFNLNYLLKKAKDIQNISAEINDH